MSREKSEKTRLRMFLLAIYVIVSTFTAYRTIEAVVDYSQCVEDVKGPWQQLLIWIGLMNNVPKCPSSSALVMCIGWDLLLLVVVVSVCEAGKLIWKILGTHKNGRLKKTEPTEALYLMKHVLRSRGEVIVIRVMRTKEEVIRLNPITHKFHTIMVCPPESNHSQVPDNHDLS